ncbi:enoyl-CoA hydratase/isomerase family protein [bacterium]|nr:enoyl-CoA hydratase/isomerase family protein [bacterium]
MYTSSTGWLDLKVEGRVAVVRMARPDGLNALSASLLEDLRDCGLWLQRQPHLSAVVLTGGERGFSAGADLRDPVLRDRLKLPMMERREHLKLGPDVCRAWEDIEAVTFAAVEGYCIGGALAIVLACDFRYAGRSAHFRLPEVELGINMSWRTLPRLAALVGPARAKEITIFCERVEADEALQIGLVEKLVEDGAAFETALARARRVADLPPLPVRMSKEAINAAVNALADTAIHMDRDQYLVTIATEDRREAVAAFLEKRKGAFKGE